MVSLLAACTEDGMYVLFFLDSFKSVDGNPLFIRKDWKDPAGLLGGPVRLGVCGLQLCRGHCVCSPFVVLALHRKAMDVVLSLLHRISEGPPHCSGTYKTLRHIVRRGTL